MQRTCSLQSHCAVAKRRARQASAAGHCAHLSTSLPMLALFCASGNTPAAVPAAMGMQRWSMKTSSGSPYNGCSGEVAANCGKLHHVRSASCARPHRARGDNHVTATPRSCAHDGHSPDSTHWSDGASIAPLARG